MYDCYKNKSVALQRIPTLPSTRYPLPTLKISKGDF